MIKAAICDPDTGIQQSMGEMLKARYGDSIQVNCYGDPTEMLKQWNVTPRRAADVLIMDMEVRETSEDLTNTTNFDVIKFVRKLQQLFPKTDVIFMSSQADNGAEVFRAQPLYFMLKPVSSMLLYKAVDRALEHIEKKRSKAIHLITKGFIAQLRTKDIHYVESERRVVHVHTDCDKISVNMKLNEMEGMLPESFLRVHQSYLVNMNQIATISAQGVSLRCGRDLPVSRPRHRDAKERFYMFLKETGHIYC